MCPRLWLRGLKSKKVVNIYIITPSREIAGYIIKQYNLKKDFNYKKLEIFRDSINQRALLITRKGKISLAAGTAYLLGRENNQGDCALLYIGLCERTTQIEDEMLLFNRVTDFETQKSYYPDILVNHSLREASLLTFTGNRENLPEDYKFFDTEASGFMGAALQFLPPHCVYCLSILKPIKQNILEVFKKNYNKLEELIFEVEGLFEKSKDRLTEEQRYALINLSRKMHFTKAMESLLIEKAEEFVIRENKNLLRIIESFLDKSVNNKKERSTFFKQLLKEL